MLRSALIAGLFLFTAGFVQAQVQKAPDIEVFGGLSYLNVAGYYEREHFFNAATGVTVNINRHFGLFGDVSLPVMGRTERSSLIDFPLGIPTPVFTSRETTKTTTALFGPRFFLRREKMTLFAHGLAGVVRTGTESEYRFGSQTNLAFGPSSSFVYHTNTFAYGFGGGVDLNVNRRFAIRVMQADYIRARIQATGNQLRLQSGVVVRFGKDSH
jgi:hypothetical protein